MHKIIHHVWTSNDKFKYPEWRLSWMKFNPDWTFYFWRLDNLPRHMMLNCVIELINLSHIPYIIKSDILRWELLRIFGGIYVDTDMECLRSFEEFLRYKSFCGKMGDKACNAIIGAESVDEELIIGLCDNVKKDISFACNSRYGIMTSTGPFATRPYLNNMERVFEQHYFYKQEDNKVSYSVHHWTSYNPGGWMYLLENKSLEENLKI